MDDRVIKIRVDTLNRINKMIEDFLLNDSEIAQKLVKRRATIDDKVNVLLDELEVTRRKSV